MEFLFPARGVVAFIGGIVFSILLAVPERGHWKDAVLVAMWGLSIELLTVTLHFIVSGLEIKKSIVRHQRNTLASVGYNPSAARELSPK